MNVISDMVILRVEREISCRATFDRLQVNLKYDPSSSNGGGPKTIGAS
jgi:hypothetical protein